MRMANFPNVSGISAESDSKLYTHMGMFMKKKVKPSINTTKQYLIRLVRAVVFEVILADWVGLNRTGNESTINVVIRKKGPTVEKNRSNQKKYSLMLKLQVYDTEDDDMRWSVTVVELASVAVVLTFVDDSSTSYVVNSNEMGK